MDFFIEFMSFVITVLFGTSMIVFLMFACIASSQEISERRKAWRAGTHDYYGNKLNDK